MTKPAQRLLAFGPHGVRLVSLIAGGLFACGSDGAGGVGSGIASPGPNGDGTGTRPLAAPKFEFSPGPPGRAVGVRAVVEVEGVELTSEPLELALTAMTESDGASVGSGAAASARLRPRTAAGFGSAQQGLTMCPTPGQTVEQMGTINGHICYVIITGSGGVFGNQRATLATTFFAREGIYQMWQTGVGASVPLSLANLTATTSFGCIVGDAPGTLGAQYWGDLTSLEFLYQNPIPFGWQLQAGTTMLISPGFGVQRAFQTDVGIELSLGDAFPIGSTLMLTSTVAGPRFLRPWNERCGAEVTDQNSLEYVRDRMAEMPSMGMGGLADALSQQIVDGTLPLLDSLSSSGAGGLDDNVPAASNGDYYAELLSSPGTDFPANPPNTSADALTVRSNDRLVAAGDDTGAILAAGVQTLREVEQSIPSLLSQATLQREAVTAARSADELGRLINPSAQDRKRFIAEDIKHLSIPSGEQAEVTLTAEELAELLGRPVADVNGATVVVNAGAAIEDASFLLEGRGLRLLVDVGGEGLLVRFDVDLSTADGTFPGDVEDWIVRPAMYQIDVEAGPAAGVILTGPRRLVSGGPASLSVQVIDDNGRRIKKPYSVRFVNAAGQEVGATNSEGGTALLQYVPDPTAPLISEVAPTVVSSGGDEGPGLEIDGVGFSRDAEVLVDGTPLVEATDFQVRAPERILVRFPATLTIGTHAVHVVNPEGLTSNDVEFSIAVEN